MRWWVARAVEGIGSKAATPRILGRLVDRLTDVDEETRFTAARAVGRLMEQGMRIFKQRNETWEVRSIAELSR